MESYHSMRQVIVVPIDDLPSMNDKINKTVFELEKIGDKVIDIKPFCYFTDILVLIIFECKCPDESLRDLT